MLGAKLRHRRVDRLLDERFLARPSHREQVELVQRGVEPTLQRVGHAAALGDHGVERLARPGAQRLGALRLLLDLGHLELAQLGLGLHLGDAGREHERGALGRSEKARLHPQHLDESRCPGFEYPFGRT